MKKFLLSIAAVIAAVFSANADTKVLWQSEEPAGVLGSWDTPFLTLDPTQTAESIQAGDILTFKVESVTEGGWPQIAIFDANTGWPPVANVGVGGKDSYPYEAQLPLTNDIMKELPNGVTIKGDGAYVSVIAVIKADEPLDPNAVWFGPQTLAWGTPASVPAATFENVKAGDKIVLNYDNTAAESSFQALIGGWSGLNIASYEAANYDFFTIDGETGTATIDLIASLADYTTTVNGEEKTYDVFALLKEGGLLVHGPVTLKSILYIPYDESSAVETVESVDAEPVYYNLQGLPVANPAAGRIYIVKKGSKVSKVIF